MAKGRASTGRTRRRWNNKRVRIFERDGGRCFWCEAALRFDVATIDHVVPQCAGGGHDDGNVVLSCRACNNDRSDTPAEVYLFAKLQGDAR